MSHFVKNSAHRPHVDSSAVDFLAQKNFGSSVPKGNNLMSVRLQRQAKRPRKSEIGDFQKLALGIDEQIAGFQVSVHDSALVAVH